MIPRYEAVKAILDHTAEAMVISTTGMISREVFMTEDRPGNFYMIGSMGLASSLGLGLALLHHNRRTFILEGDGSALMSLGTLALIAAEAPPNLIHIVLDNEAYESTGGQPSISSDVNLAQIGRAAGYRRSTVVDEVDDLVDILSRILEDSGPHLILVKVSISPVEGVPRVSYLPVEIRDRFRTWLHGQAPPSFS